MKNNTQSSLTVFGLAAGQRYYVRVRTYRTNSDNKNYFSSWSKAIAVVTQKPNPTKPKTTSLSSVVAKYNGFAVYWKKQIENTLGYQIQCSTNNRFTANKRIKTVKSNQKTAILFSGLKADTRYYVRVRTYSAYKGRHYFSAWSKAMSVVALSKAPKPPTILLAEQLSENFGTVHITYSPVENCSYQLQVSPYRDFRACRHTTLHTYPDTSIEEAYYQDRYQWEWDYRHNGYLDVYSSEGTLVRGVRYYFRMRTYKATGGKLYYSKWSNIKSVVVP